LLQFSIDPALILGLSILEYLYLYWAHFILILYLNYFIRTINVNSPLHISTFYGLSMLYNLSQMIRKYQNVEQSILSLIDTIPHSNIRNFLLNKYVYKRVPNGIDYFTITTDQLSYVMNELPKMGFKPEYVIEYSSGHVIRVILTD